jgi:hypothetical protein
MRPTARTVAFLVAVIAGVLWLSAIPLRGWPLAVIVVAALIVGTYESERQKRMERRWLKSWWLKWRSHV